MYQLEALLTAYYEANRITFQNRDSNVTIFSQR